MENDTATAVRKPRFAYHEVRPDAGLPLTQWAIERQLSLAADYDEPDLVAVLQAMNPALDESIRVKIENLLDLAEHVDLAENTRAEIREMWVDEYHSALRELAKLITEAKPAPTRPRHVLGATS